jgi:hypothetical protein
MLLDQTDEGQPKFFLLSREASRQQFEFRIAHQFSFLDIGLKL